MKGLDLYESIVFEGIKRGKKADESVVERSERTLNFLRKSFPGKKAFDLDGRALHFVCEVEPTKDHPEYDRAIEVIISSKPHKHLKMTQYYTVLFGEIEVYVDGERVVLRKGDKCTIEPGQVHWAKTSSESDSEAIIEIYSTPGWTKEDHIVVDL